MKVTRTGDEIIVLELRKRDRPTFRASLIIAINALKHPCVSERLVGTPVISTLQEILDAMDEA